MTSRQSCERAGFLDGRRLDVAMVRAERLPFERQQPVALEIAEGAVVGEHVEPVAACARTRGPACDDDWRATPQYARKSATRSSADIRRARSSS